MRDYNAKNKENARELRTNMTIWERKLWYEFLRAYPVRFQRQKTIDNFVVDFYCHEAKLAIELDGSQHYTEEGERYDEERSAILERYGLIILRFSNLEIDRNFEGVCVYIDQIVNSRLIPQ